MQHIASCCMIRTAEELSYRASFVLQQTLRKFKSLQGTELSVALFSVAFCSCDLFIRTVLNFNFGFKVLTDRNKRSELL